MGVQSRQHHYHPAAKTFHWLVAVILFFVWPMGFMSLRVKAGLTNDFFFWHESFGFLIFWLMLARLWVRFMADTPAKPALMPAWQAGVARWNQWLLYLALICQPILGFLMVTSQGGSFQWFGLISVPSLTGDVGSIKPFLIDAHIWNAWIILSLVGLHVCGALYHRVIRRDDTLARMT